ncbi:MAG: (5-formylfuran-3-yl)methyl phosphate synthase [Rhodopirellula sp. JB044]|uniref:(5-formylfuran-3-yl)methyl phosphate synthase n=1 Tax=Rhodopirellula sp. JB044 TaxID=3342844 RepID=UPI003709D1C3
MSSSNTLSATPRPKLLVSVRNICEATQVADSGVDVIDFKEPKEGALAPVSPEIWRDAAATLSHCQLSAALGEKDDAVSIASKVPNTFRYAKVGPSCIRSRDRLRELWDSLDLPPDVELVPVAYADHRPANCLAPADVLETVIASGRKRLLLDTFVKSGESLTDHVPVEQLAALVQTAHQAGIWLALAGSVRLSQVTRLHRLGVTPDCWGVRGNVCNPAFEEGVRRTGTIDARLLHAWVDAFKPSSDALTTAGSESRAPH